MLVQSLVTCINSNEGGVAVLVQSRVTCVNGDPGHMLLSDTHGQGSARCPNGTTLVGCSYWDSARHHQGNGVGTMATQSNTCSTPGCATCTVYASCQGEISS